MSFCLKNNTYKKKHIFVKIKKKCIRKFIFLLKLYVFPFLFQIDLVSPNFFFLIFVSFYSMNLAIIKKKKKTFVVKTEEFS
jgi:hypothetical protein